jgi:ABC-type uncharacterized transport system
MATGAVPNNANLTPATMHNQKSTAIALLVGLAWGALMLVIFGFWMRFKYDNAPRPIITNIFLLAGVASAVLAIWQAFTLWFKSESPEQRYASLEQQRRIFSYVFLVGGLGLLVMACFLGIGQKPGSSNYTFLWDNFAESFGVLLFGIIALFSGYVLQMPTGDNVSPIQFLVDKVPMLKISLLVIAVLCLGTLIWIVVTKRTTIDRAVVVGGVPILSWTDFFPELTALLFTSMLCLGCFLWLNTGKFDEFGVRLFVLIFGGSVGLILFCETIARAIIWRQDILLGGSVAWQGPDAWKFWLCSYLMFTALALMFFSFNLARTDIRKNVALRRVMYGYDAIVQMLLLIGVLFILNVVIYALYPFTFEWTRNRGAYDLSDSSKNLIANLKEETHVFVLITQATPYYKDVRNLLDNCQAISNHKLDVKYISPDADRGPFAELARKFPAIFPEGTAVDSVRGILIVYGKMPTGENDKGTYAFVPDRKLVDVEGGRPGEKPKYLFNGEVEILKEIKFLVDKQKKRKIYVLQGEGAVDLDNFESRIERRSVKGELSALGIGIFADQLAKDNYEVVGLNFGTEVPGEKTRANIVYVKEGPDKRKDVPDDCQTLIVAGIAKPLPKETLDAIERYMERGGPDKTGGRMIVFLEDFVDLEGTTLRNNGIEEVLRRYGVEVTNDIPLRLMENERDDPRLIKATPPRNTEHALAKQFLGETLFMKRGARIVKPAEMGGRFKAETLLQLDFRPNEAREGIIVKDVKALLDPIGYAEELAKGGKLMELRKREPIPVAVAVTETNGSAPRLVVFGDTEFITNRELVYFSRGPNYDIAVSSIDWMAGRESLGARPRSHDFVSIDATAPFWQMVLLPGWLMFLGFISLGVAVWVVRRR